MMTLLEKERQLINEIDFFNNNIAWWVLEFQKANTRFEELQRNYFVDTPKSEVDELAAQLKYLVGKVKIEEKTAKEIDKKIYKLNLQKELVLIQGDKDEYRKTSQEKVSKILGMLGKYKVNMLGKYKVNKRRK